MTHATSDNDTYEMPDFDPWTPTDEEAAIMAAQEAAYWADIHAAEAVEPDWDAMADEDSEDDSPA
jgi:hypothetical protein